MAQRYICTEPAMGANFYQTYAPTPNLYGTPTYGGPDQVSQLGIFPGLAVNGSFNTKWMFCLTSPTAPALGPNATAVAVLLPVAPFTATPFVIIPVAGAPANSTPGTTLVTLPASNAGNAGVGVWVEIGQAAPLNPAPMGFETEDNEPEPTPPNGEIPPPDEGTGNLPSHIRRRTHTGGPLA